MIPGPLLGSLALLLVIGSAAQAADAEPSAAHRQKPMAADLPHTFAVELCGSVPSWFGGLTIPGWHRMERTADAALRVTITGNEPVVLWTAWQQDDGRYAWTRGRRPWLDRGARSALVGRGSHHLQVAIAVRGEGEAVTAIDLSCSGVEVRLPDPERNRYPGPVVIPTPDGRALAWADQRWASAFATIEAILAQRCGAVGYPAVRTANQLVRVQGEGP